jgi:DnaJ-domain-containing protein 1
MDGFFDRLGELLRSLVRSESSNRTGYDSRDPDMRAALEELDRYLSFGSSAAGQARGSAGRNGRQGENGGRRDSPGGQTRRTEGPRPHQQETHLRPPASEQLRQDYANLEVPFAASLEQVQSAYRRLLRHYHPDRFVRDAEKQQLATEITKRLNESFQNIRRHHRENPPPG